MANKTYNDHPTDNTPAADDLIPYWDVASSAAKKATRAKIVGATITGDGTIDTGGETLTVPATGTAALRDVANTFTANQYITGAVGINTVSPQAALDVRGQMYSTGQLGWYGEKTNVSNNTATNIATIQMSGSGHTGTFLVSARVSATGITSAQVFVVSSAFDNVNVHSASQSLYGFSSVTMTGTISGDTITLRMTQVNPGTLAATVRIAIQPLALFTSATTCTFAIV